MAEGEGRIRSARGAGGPYRPVFHGSNQLFSLELGASKRRRALLFLILPIPVSIWFAKFQHPPPPRTRRPGQLFYHHSAFLNPPSLTSQPQLDPRPRHSGLPHRRRPAVARNRT